MTRRTCKSLQDLFRRKGLVKEWKAWSEISFLSTLQNCTELTPWVLSLAFVGMVSSTQLAALSLVEIWVYSFLEIAWLAVTQTASVLIAQAHGGQAHAAKLGWLFIAMVMMTVACIIVSMASVSTVYALHWMTNDEVLVVEGSYYASAIIPAIFFASYEQVISTYLISTGHVGYSSTCALFFAVVDIITTYLFMFGGLGFRPYANALTANAMSWNVSSFLGLTLTSIILWTVSLQEENSTEEKDEVNSIDSESMKLKLDRQDSNLISSPCSIELTSSPTRSPVPVPHRASILNKGGSVDDSQIQTGSGKGIQHQQAAGNWLIFPESNSNTPKKPSSTVTRPFEKRSEKLYSEYDSVDSTSEGEEEDIEQVVSNQEEIERSSMLPPFANHEHVQKISASVEELMKKKNIVVTTPSNSTKRLRLSLDGGARSTLSLEALELVAEVKPLTILDWIQNRQAWWVFIQLLMPFVATAAMESMIFFALAFLAAQLGRSQIAAHNICVAILEYTFSLIVGMAEATSVRVGYYVGKGHLAGSLTVSLIAFVNSLVLGILLAVICSFYSREIAEIFTTDEEIIENILQVSPLVWASFAIFSVGDQMLAILEGQGRGSMQMIAIFVGLWIVTLPLAAWLFYVEEGGLRDIWLALLIGYVISEIIAVYAVWKSDWESIFERAKDHMTLD